MGFKSRGNAEGYERLSVMIDRITRKYERIRIKIEQLSLAIERIGTNYDRSYELMSAAAIAH